MLTKPIIALFMVIGVETLNIATINIVYDQNPVK
jgi:hypothetical protein